MSTLPVRWLPTRALAPFRGYLLNVDRCMVCGPCMCSTYEYEKSSSSHYIIYPTKSSVLFVRVWCTSLVRERPCPPLCVTLYIGETTKSAPSSRTVNALVSLKNTRTMCFVLGTTTPNRTGSNAYGRRLLKGTKMNSILV